MITLQCLRAETKLLRGSFCKGDRFRKGVRVPIGVFGVGFWWGGGLPVGKEGQGEEGWGGWGGDGQRNRQVHAHAFFKTTLWQTTPLKFLPEASCSGNEFEGTLRISERNAR